jgi:SAM-dependent methyltransferase
MGTPRQALRKTPTHAVKESPMSHTVLPDYDETGNRGDEIAGVLKPGGLHEESSLYHCVRCHGGLKQSVRGDLLCGVCEAFYPSIKGVQVLVSNPDQLLRKHAGWLPERRKEIEEQRAKVRAAFDEKLHAPESLAAMEESYDGLLANLELIERQLEPVRQYLDDRGEPTSFFGELAGGGWPGLEMLEYFYRDWHGTKEAAALSRLFTDPIERFCHERESVAVLGCGAGGLVYAVAELFPSTFGVDLAIDTLLLSKKLLDGEHFTLHYNIPRMSFPISRKTVRIEGAARKREGINLLAANVQQLPFRSSSLSCVITQYMMDIVSSQKKIASEIHRVLAPGGVWLDFSLPLSINAADQFNSLELPLFLRRSGFELLEQSMHRFSFLDLAPLSEWAWTSSQTPVRFVAEKVFAPHVEPPDYFARYFAGTSDAIWDKVPRRVVNISLVHERRFTDGGVREQHGLAVLHLNNTRPGNFAVTNETAVLIEWFLRAVDGTRTIREIFDLMRKDYGEILQAGEMLKFFSELEESSFIEIG